MQHDKKIKFKSLSLRTAKKIILSEISFEINSSTFVAILGLGGSGKTALLDFIAGRSAKQICSSGQVLMNNTERSVSTWGHQMAYVECNIDYYAYETVYCSLYFVARMKNTTDKILVTLEILDLLDDKDTRIANLSKDKRRLLAIGLQLVSDPEIILLDDPTANLDFFTAIKIIRMLKDLVLKQQKIVILSINNPVVQIYKCFDKILILYDTHLLYDGTIQECVEFYKYAGYTFPQYTNLCLRFLEILGDEKAQSPIILNEALNERKNMPEIKLEWELHRCKFNVDEDNCTNDSIVRLYPDASYGDMIATFNLIFMRAMRNMTLNRHFVYILTGERFLFLIFLGITHMSLGYIGEIISSRVGVIGYLMINTVFSVASPTFNILPRIKSVTRRERTSNLYNGYIAFFANVAAIFVFANIYLNLYLIPLYWIMHLNEKFDCFLMYIFVQVNLVAFSACFSMCISALTADETVSQVLGMGLLFVFSLFSGTYTQLSIIPSYIKWIVLLSPISYALRATIQGQLSGKLFYDNSGNVIMTGEDVLSENQFDKLNPWVCIFCMWGLTLLYGFVGATILHYTSRMRLHKK